MLSSSFTLAGLVLSSFVGQTIVVGPVIVSPHCYSVCWEAQVCSCCFDLYSSCLLIERLSLRFRARVPLWRRGNCPWSLPESGMKWVSGLQHDRRGTTGESLAAFLSDTRRIIQYSVTRGEKGRAQGDPGKLFHWTPNLTHWELLLSQKRKGKEKKGKVKKEGKEK